MSHAHTFLNFLFLFLSFSAEGAFYGHLLAHCQFSAYDGHDATYLEQYYFNKVLEIQYNSSVGKLVGYTKKAKETADKFNSIPSYVKYGIWKTELCRRNPKLSHKDLLISVEPYVRLRSVKKEDGKHLTMLLCSAYNFYPKQIKVTWLRDGKTVTADVTSTDELSNANWLYQIHSYLEYRPRAGERITCMVEHASFKEPKLHDWAPDEGMKKIAVGTAGLLVGLVFSLSGLVYYKMKSAAHVLVPTTEVLYPENTL